LLGGCSAVVGDLGGYTEDPAACVMDGDRSSVRDFRLELRELSPHLTHYFEASIVNAMGGNLQAHLIIEPLEFGTQDIVVESMVPPGDYFLDFYADINANQAPDLPPTDHTWRRPLCSNGVVNFTHIFEFEPLDGAIAIGPDMSLDLTNIPAALQDLRVEMRFIFASEGTGQGRTVGMYRRNPLSIGGPMIIGNVVDAGSQYAVMWFIDMNDDVAPNEGDIFCGVLETAPADGVTPMNVSVDLTAALSDGTCAFTSLDYEQLL
jgi:hypothetical protein